MASVIGVLGLFIYGFLAWFFKRLINQLDDMTKLTVSLHAQLSSMNNRLSFVENKVGATLGAVTKNDRRTD